MAQRRFEKLSDDELLSDWVHWITRIYEDARNLAWNRSIFRRLEWLYVNNQQLQKTGGYLWEWMTENYVSGAAMTLRRDLDGADTLNLVHLLHEIEKRPSVLTRKRHYDRWGSITSDAEGIHQRSSFDQFQLTRDPIDEMKDHIDPEMVRTDRTTLQQETEVVRTYVEQTIAHRSRGEANTVTFAQFDAAIDAIHRTFKKYYAMLTLTSLAQTEPVAQFNTHEVFTFPWDPTALELWSECLKEKRLDWDTINFSLAYDGITPFDAKSLTDKEQKPE